MDYSLSLVDDKPFTTNCLGFRPVLTGREFHALDFLQGAKGRKCLPYPKGIFKESISPMTTSRVSLIRQYERGRGSENGKSQISNEAQMSNDEKENF
jgi:hypothetical protein